jgi:hypothetical protein
MRGRDDLVVLDELGDEFERALAATPITTRRSRTRWRAGGLAAVGFLVLAGAALASGLVSPWQTNEPAGNPPIGRFELKANAGGTTWATLVWRPERATAGAQPGDICVQTGPETVLKTYPVGDGGSCFDPERVFGEHAIVASLRMERGVLIVDGMARSDVESVRVEGPGWKDAAQLSERSRALLAVHDVGSQGITGGTVTVEADLKGGRTERTSFPLRSPGASSAVPRFPLSAASPQTRPISVSPSVGGPDTTFGVVVAQRSDGMYEFDLSGPGGEDCQGRLSASFGILTDRITAPSGFVRRPLPPQRIDPFSPKATSSASSPPAQWCAGQYELTARFVAADGQSSKVSSLQFEVK